MSRTPEEQYITALQQENKRLRMGQPLFEVFVPGVPRPQGSKVNLGRGRMKESSPHLKAWRGLVTTRSAIIWKRNPPIDQSVHLDVVFVMPARKREPDPGGWHTATPDLDKLIRAIGDALTMAGILHDDSRIAAITATKRRARHGEPPGAHIHLDTLERNPNANKEEVPR
ncbi:RusA family crossover junction endodeoxyribonuclease [Corynebacterium striatum]|nr:RusA family crossover junction endodeoxyribonuclease [Corynebacterium striatum]